MWNDWMNALLKGEQIMLKLKIYEKVLNNLAQLKYRLPSAPLKKRHQLHLVISVAPILDTSLRQSFPDKSADFPTSIGRFRQE